MIVALVQIDRSGVEELIDTSYVSGWDVLWAVVTVIAGIILARLARRGAKRALSRMSKLPDNLVQLVVKVIGWSIAVFFVVIALPFIGVDIGPIIVVILLVVALAVLSGRVLLENVGAGIILQAESMFEPGDQIITNDSAGRVVEVSSRSVKVEALDGRRIVVPNAAVLASPLVNLTARSERRSELLVGLAYGTQLDAARTVLLEAARSAPGVLAEPEVEVYVTEFADSSIVLAVWYWHESDIQSGYVVTDAVARSIDRSCREHGLTIPFPQRTLWWGEQPPTEAS